MSQLRSLPLTDLSEDETRFRAVVRRVRRGAGPPARARDGPGVAIPRELIDACFELGIMGIEIPEQHGGAGRHLLHVDPRGRGAGARRPVGGGARRRPEHAGQQRDPALGERRAEGPLLPEARLASGSGAYALSEAGSGSDAFALACRAEDKGDHFELTGRKLWITNAAEAELFIVMANLDPAKGYKGITSFLVERSVPGLLGRQEGGQARHPRLLHLRADPRRLPRAEGERARRAGQGLQDRHRDAQRGAHRHRRADGGARPGRLRARPPATRRSGSSSARPIAEFQAVQFQLAELATQIEAARLLTYNAARLRDVGPPSSRKRPWRSSSPRAPRSTSPRRRSRSTAATASPASTPSRSTSATRRSARSTRARPTCSSLVIAKQILGKM